MGILTGNRLRLRPLEKSDAPLLASWMNDHEVTQYLLRYLPVSITEEEEWIAGLCKNDTTSIVWGIGIDSSLVGVVGLHRIDHRVGTSVLGILLGDKTRWGQGYGAEAILLVVRYAFDMLNLQKVSLKVHATNKRARACYAKCGFREEGRLKRDVYVRGKYQDTILMAVFRPASP